MPDEGAVLTEDHVFQRSHPHTGDSDIDAWVLGLDWLEICGASPSLPGHGDAGGAVEPKRMKDHLLEFQSELGELKPFRLLAAEIAGRLELLRVQNRKRKRRNIGHRRS